jgi:predicted transcriptional regulator
MSSTNQEPQSEEQSPQERPKGKPGRKRLGDEVFVPVTMKVEPAELATINAIAKASHRSRSDVMREMLSYGLAHMMESAFSDSGAKASRRESVPAADPDGGRVLAATSLPPDLLAQVDALSRPGDRGRSAAMRRAVEEGLRVAGYLGGEDD